MVERWAEWRVNGAAFNAVEQYEGSPLSVAYTQNVDTRWFDMACLGPLINTVDCGAAGGTAADAGGSAIGVSGTGVEYLYVIRGTKWAKVQLSNMTLISDNSETALSEAATDVISIKNANGSQFVLFGMDDTAYRVITTVSDTVTDTASSHASEKMRVFGNMGGEASAPRLGGVFGQTIKMLVLSTTVSPVTGVWETRATIPDEVTPTSLRLDGNFWVPGTSEGPYYLNNDFQTFRQIVQEIGSDPDNCRIMREYSYLGLIIGLSTGTRYQKNIINGASIGPEVYDMNTTPIQGKLTGFAATERWGYMNIYNPVTDDTYLCAVRPRQDGDWHGRQMSYYPLAHFTDTSSNFLDFTDKAGGRTNPTLVGGYDDDIFYVTLGRIAREIDDTAYRYATSGSWYGTKMRHPSRYDKLINYVAIETENCSANRTITVSLSMDGGAYEQIGAPITSDGLHRIVIDGDLRGRQVQPRIAFATNDSEQSPRITCPLRMSYELVPAEDENGERYE